MFAGDLVLGKDVEGARAAAQKVVEVHRALVGFLAIGQTLDVIDAFVGKTLRDLGCKSCFFRYAPSRMPPFPSQSCLSVNDCIVHGRVADYTRPLREGDVLSVDVGTLYKGWMGDAAWTYVFGGLTATTRKMTSVGRESLRRGIAALRVGSPWLVWAEAVQGCVEDEAGLHLARGLGGHGYGRKLHGPPFVSNVRPERGMEWREANQLITPGTLVALEPMIAWGTGQTRNGDRQWPIYTADGSLAVHYEHDVLITDDGPMVLSEGMDELPDVITRAV